MVIHLFQLSSIQFRMKLDNGDLKELPFEVLDTRGLMEDQGQHSVKPVGQSYRGVQVKDLEYILGGHIDSGYEESIHFIII